MGWSARDEQHLFLVERLQMDARTGFTHADHHIGRASGETTRGVERVDTDHAQPGTRHLQGRRSPSDDEAALSPTDAGVSQAGA